MDFTIFKECNARFNTIKLGFLKILILLVFIPALVDGQIQPGDQNLYLPVTLPTITGPDSACAGVGGYIYVTEPGMTNYNWTVSAGGTINSGNGTNSITVTWNSAGSDTLNVTYNSVPSPGVLQVTVLPSPVVGITITASANPSCGGAPVTFTATPSNGGSSPVFQWQVNGINIGTNSTTYTYLPANGDLVSCQLMSNVTCPMGNPATSNVISMTVTPNLTVSVSISASVNPVCQGTPVTFSAIPFNGGTSPVYQWKVNGINAGINSSTYSYIPLNGDIVTCQMTSNATCTSGNPATSNPITMTVSPSQPVGITITASANPSCQNNPVTFTATPINGGSSPVYEWKVDGIVTGTNSPILIYTPGNGDIVTCKLTSNASCATGNPATSNPTTMVVDPNVPVSVSVSPSANPVCQGSSVTFTATPVNGGSVPVFQWTINGFNVGTNSPTYTYIPASGDIVLCQLTSNLNCVTGNPAISNPVTMTVNLNLFVSVSIFASSNPVCNGNSVTLTAIPYNGGTSPFYQWKLNGVNVGTNNSTYTFTPANGDVVTCQLTSNAPCASGNPATSNSIAITVSPNLPASVSIVVSANPICQDIPVTFTATPTNGGISPSYQWKVNGTNAGTNSPTFTYTPQNNDIVTCIMTSSAPCTTGNPATSNAITMTIITGQTLPVSITITASANPSCQGQNVTYTATPVNGGSTPAYQWMVNGLNVGTNSPTYSYIPTNGDFVKCQLTSSYSCVTGNPATSNQIAMTVNPNLSVSVSIVASANPSCLGSPVTFTATPVNGGSSPAYQWKVNGGNAGTSQNTYSYVPANGNVVTCVLTSSVPCPTNNPVTSNAITMNVLPLLPVGITISTLTNPSCMGTQVTFTATPSNGGSAPVYQWKINGINTGPNNSTLIFTPMTGDVVNCQITSNATCVSGSRVVMSNSITMVVSKELPAGVSITATVNPFCHGTPVTFTATPANGGTVPIYLWKVNCLTVGTNSPMYTYNPADGDFVYCQMTSNLICATMNPAKSNAITMSVNATTPAGISILPSANPVCTGTSVTFTATPTNGGSAPIYQWKVNGLNAGGNSSAFTYTPVNGDIVTCRLTSNAACVSGSPATSNPVTMVVSTSLAAGVSISTPTNPFCDGFPVTFTATPVNGGSAPVYQWKNNGTNVGSNSPTFTYTPVNGDVISCSMTSNLSCASGNPCQSNQITMVSSTSLPVSIAIAASATTVCQGTPVTFTTTITNGGNNPVYQWKVNGINGGTNSLTYTYTPANGDIVTCQLTSDLICATGNPATSNTISMTVNPVLAVSVSITSSCNPCCLGTPVTFTAIPVNGGSSPGYQWIINCINVGTNSPTYTYTPANGDVVICRLTSSETCTSGSPAISNNINMIVLPILPVSVTIEVTVNPYCQGSNVSFIATHTNGGFSPIYQWKVNRVNEGSNSSVFTYAPSNGDTVTCEVTSSLTCVSGNPALSNQIIMVAIVNLPVSVSISASLNPICAGTLVAFTATPTNGGPTPVYQWKVNGVNAGPNNNTYQYYPVNGDIVTCILTSSLTCATGNPATSNAITMTVYPIAPVSITIAASSNPCCQGATVTFTATPVNGGTAPSYQWKVNGFIVGTDSPTYTYSNPQNGDVITCRLISNAICRTGNPATSNAITMIVSPSDPCSVSISASANPVCQGTSVTFTATPFNGGSAPIYQWKVNGINAGTNSSTFIYVPVNNDVVTCHMTSNSPCITIMNANSNAITMTVSPIQPVSISITAAVNPTCVGSSVTYTAITVNGGSSPVYQWKVNGTVVGGNSPDYTYIPVNGDVVVCKLTSNATCTSGNPATSNSITMTVSTSLPASISIGAAANPSCQGQPVTYTANSINGGVSPIYQWMVNGINVGTNSPAYVYSPSNGDFVTCQLTSSFSCATGNPALSNQIITTVNPNQPVSVSISGSANPTCQGTSITFTAIPVNGGSLPVYHWKVNGMDEGNNLPTYSYVPINADVITCQLNSNATCPVGNPANSNTITMNVLQPLPVGVSIIASTNPTCPGTTVIYTATPSNGGSSPQYQWKVNGINAGTNFPVFSYIPSNGDSITCQLTSNAICIFGNPGISNQIIMVVSSELGVSVSIAASSNPACLGQMVTYTATAVNGGTSPAYQWMVNGINVGTNNPVYSYTPSNGDSVICHLTSDLTCATGNPAVSNKISMAVTSYLPVSVFITSSANPVCLGSPVTFTATPTNGGSSPVYQWKVNGINVGPSLITYTYVPVNGDIVSCQLTSSETCASDNPAISNQLFMVVSTDLPVSVSITASGNPVCQGIPVTFTATPTNGGSSPLYQWKVNGLNVGTNSTVYSYIPGNGDVVNCILTSNLTCATGSPATSNPITMTINPTLPADVSIVANPSGAVCAGTSVIFTATPSNGGTPFYQWLKNGFPAGSNSPVYSYVPSSGDQIFCVMTSSLSCVSGNPATSNTIAMVVNPLLSVSVSIVVNQNNICEGTTVTFTASPSNGGIPFYQWYKNGVTVGSNQSTYSCTLLNGDQVYVVMTSNLSCTSGNPATSNTVTMVVNPILPVSVSAGVDQNNICAGTSVTFTATPVNGGTPFYQWYKNGVTVGSNQPTYSCIPLNGDQVFVVMTSNLACTSGSPSTSNTITMVVTPVLPVSVSLGVDQNNICAGTSVTFTATPVNGGTPSYQWYKNGVTVGSNQPTYTYVPINGDQVHVVMTSNLVCTSGNPATSNTVMMIVNPILPVSVSAGVDQNNICSGTSVTFTATPVNGGTPSYQWYKNVLPVGTNQPTYTYVPINGDQVYVVLTSNLVCTSGSPATSNTIMMVVNAILPVSVSLGVDQNNICAGTSVTFTATPVNGGTSHYQWYKNGITVGSNQPTYSYVPVNGDQVYVVMTSNLVCTSGNPATSNTVMMVVNPILPVSVSASVDQNNICAGTSVTFTATPVNGGTPSYQWYKNVLPVGTNQPTYTYVPINGDQVYVVMTSNLVCTSGSPATSNTVTMVVNPILPVSVSIGVDQNNICAGTSVTFTATPVNGGTPSYQWYKNGVTAGSNQPSYSCIPLNGDQVYVVMTSSLPCISGSPATSNTVTMVVNPILSVSVSIGVDQNNICAGTSVTFTATPVNGGTPVYQWYKNASPVGSNQPTYTYVPVNGDQVHVVMTSSLPCISGSPATSNTVTMVVNPILSVSVSIGVDQNNICAGTSVTFTATPVNGGTPVYQWYKNALPVGSNQPTYTYVPVNGDQVYVVMTSSLPCISGSPATSNTITMIVNPILPVNVTITVDEDEVCEGTSVLFTANPSNGGTPTYQWYKNSLPVGSNQPIYSCVPSNGDQVYVVMTSSEPCTSGNPATSNSITITVDTPVPVDVTITVDQNNVCEGTSVTFTATPTNEGSPIYQWFQNGYPVGGNQPTYTCVPSNNDLVYVVMVSSLTCVTNNPATSNTIIMIVNLLPGAAGTISGPSDVCDGESGVNYSVVPITDAVSYVWSLPPGATIVAGNNTPNITVDFSQGANSGIITVYGSNACGNGTLSPDFSVTVNPIPPTPVVTANGQDLHSSAPAGNQWYYNGAIIPGATGQNYFATQPGWYWTVVTLNTCSSDTSNHVYVAGVGIEEKPAGANFLVYPVPNNGCFTVSITLPSEETYNIIIYNNLGAQIYQLRDVKVREKFEKVIDLRPLPDGKYLIVFSGIERMVVSKILVQK